MWGIGCWNPLGTPGFWGPSSMYPYMGGMWGCSSYMMGPMYSPWGYGGGFGCYNPFMGYAGSMVGGGLGGALGYLAAGGMRNPWAGMTGYFLGNALGSGLGWLAGSAMCW